MLDSINSDVKSDALTNYERWPILVGGVLAVLSLLLLGSVLNRASMVPYQNWDDAYYSSIGVQWAATGEWRPAMQPLGLAPSDSYFAANPILTPYLTGVCVKLFGPHRWATHLPSLGASALASVALIWMVHVLQLRPAHGLVVMFSYYACPWLYFAMNTARAEPLCIAGLYLSALFAVKWAIAPKTFGTSAWPLLSGFLATLTVWNHPLFAAAVLLPAILLFAYAGKADARRGILLWLAGACLMLVCLIGWRILPHWEAWKEQFLANASNNATISGSVKTLDSFKSSQPFPLNELVELKARLSALGWPFVCWYAGLPFLFLAFLRTTRLFLFTLLFLLSFLVLIELKTPVIATYVVNVMLALPVCLLLAASRCPEASLSGVARPLLGSVVVLISVLHGWLVLRPATGTNPWNEVEQQLGREFQALPPRSIIFGGIAEGMMPAWEQGHTYYMTSNNFLMNVPGVQEKLDKLVSERAYFHIENVNGQWRVAWPGGRVPNVKADGNLPPR